MSINTKSGKNSKNTLSEFVEGGISKKAKKMPHSDIKSAELFHQNFPGFTFEKKSSLVNQSGWDDSDGLTQISEWLQVVNTSLVPMYARIERNSEAALYPLLITSLLPAFDLCDCAVTGSVVPEVPVEIIAQLASEIAESQSRTSSWHTSVDTGNPVSASTPAHSSYSSPKLPASIDTTDQEDVFKFIVFIEEWMKSADFISKGRVEILIHNTETDEVVVVIEAKPRIDTVAPFNEGLYQCGAYMVISKVKFGIYTDHKTFQFLRLGDDNVIRHSRLMDMMNADYLSLHEARATRVYAHLFEVMGVPRNTDLLARATASKANWALRAAELVKNCK